MCPTAISCLNGLKANLHVCQARNIYRFRCSRSGETAQSKNLRRRLAIRFARSETGNRNLPDPVSFRLCRWSGDDLSIVSIPSRLGPAGFSLFPLLAPPYLYRSVFPCRQWGFMAEILRCSKARIHPSHGIAALPPAAISAGRPKQVR